MNTVREFASWRPDVAELDDASAEALWASIVGDEAPPAVDRVDAPLDDRPHVIALAETIPTARRLGARTRAWWPLVASAAAVVVGVAGIVALGQRRADAPTTPGSDGPGVTFDASAGTEGWAAFPAMPIQPRFQYAAVPTDTGIFVWGGCCANGTSDQSFTDGAYYDETGWRVLPDAPLGPTRGDALAVWTGTEVVVMNGIEGVIAAAFDPATWTWRSLTAPDMRSANNGGGRLLVVGPDRLALIHEATVELYDVVSDTWSVPMTVDGIDVETPVDDSPPVTGYGATSSYLAVSTAADIDACAAVRLRLLDVAALTWSTVEPGTTDWVPTDVVGLPDGRFLVSGGGDCGTSPTGPPRAMVLDPATETFQWVASPPISSGGFRYGGIIADDAVAYLDQTGALLVYRPGADTWTIGPSLLDGNPNTDAVRLSETPLIWFDDRIVVVSPGYVQEETGGTDASSCCYPTGDAWFTQL